MFIGKDSKSFMDHIQRMASGEAPFFSTTLSLVYDRVVERLFTKRVPPGHDPSELTEGQSTTVLTPPQPSTSTPRVTPPSIPRTPTSIPGPISPSASGQLTWLKCARCSGFAQLQVLFDGLYCPQCPSGSGIRGRPFMRCQLCQAVRVTRTDSCKTRVCQGRFM